jgi:tetratricopeptide (TPR) repeat protein
MSRTIRFCYALTLALSVVPAASARAATHQAGPDSLANAISLYSSAAYEQALAALADVREDADRDQVDTYRALCLIALDRSEEAEHVLEQLVTRTPRYLLDERDLSPKIVSLFRDVRRRVIPVAVRRLYTNAKEEFDAQKFASAAASFREIVALVTDESADEGESRSQVLDDVAQLAKGFLELSEARLHDTGSVSAPTAVAPATRETEIVTRAAATAIYGSANADVKPPIVVNQTLPSWIPPANLASMTFHGRLEIVIDENGTVQAASIAAPTHILYDKVLLSATRSWRYQPAMKDGQAVKYRKLIAIDLLQLPPRTR